MADKKTLEEQKNSSTSHLMKRILGTYVRPHIWTISFATSLMVISAGMTGGMAKLMEPIIDDVFSAGNVDKLWPVALAVLAAFSIRGITTYGHTVLMGKIGQSIIATVQKEMFSHLIEMDLIAFNKSTSGHFITRMISDVMIMRGAVTDSISGIVKSSLTLFVLLGVMMYQDWKLTIGALLVFPLAGLVVAKIGKRLRSVSTSVQEEIGELSSVLNQSFQGIKHIKAYGLEGHEKNRINSSITKVYKLYCKAIRVSALATPMSEVLSGLAIVTIIIYGGYQVVEGSTTAGKLFSFITAFLLAYEPMKRLAKLNAVLQTGLAAAERIFAVIDMKPSITSKKDAVVLEVKKAPSLSFNKVDFSYVDENDNEKLALKNLSFDVPAGKTVALVGPSGAGKTTIINLVLRFYDAQSGEIKIDGKDIYDVTLGSLRSHISMVSQDVTIFNDSVMDNIRMGRFGATDIEIEEAAKAATAHEFIMELADGYKTKLGENGLKLSGGQRQRIAIARAMLRNAPLLLLDEATSALDNTSERLVQKALETLQKGRTTLVIAHRLSTVQNADIIYVLDNGYVSEHGNHQELLENNGLYKQLYG